MQERKSEFVVPFEDLLMYCFSFHIALMSGFISINSLQTATKEVRSLIYWNMSSDIEQDEIGVYNIYGAKISDRSKISFDQLNLYSGYLIWNCSGIEAGVYLIIIKHGTETRTIKVMVN